MNELNDSIFDIALSRTTSKGKLTSVNTARLLMNKSNYVS